jgi:putative NADPH-quinone reductase
MRLLAVHCHPSSESFGAAVTAAVIAAAREAGHELRLIDLYAEQFDPVMSGSEWAGYHTPGRNEAPVRAHLDLLKWADGLIFIYPTWWYSQPAMLKGWIDRVWVPHATFSVPSATTRMAPLATNIRLIGVFTTLGSPWWWWNVVMGAPGRKIILRGIRACCHRRCRTFWMGLHDMDSTDDAARHAYLARVARKVKALR